MTDFRGTYTIMVTPFDADGRLDLDGGDPHLAGGLVGEERDQLVGEPAEGRGVRALVPQVGPLVGDERVVGNVDAHTA